MENLVILTDAEEEHLIRSLESALHVRNLRQFFLWVQGQLQSLLPHEIMVCIQFAENDDAERIECISGMVHNHGMIKGLCHPENGLVVRLARYCRANLSVPCAIEKGGREEQHPLADFQAEITQCQLGNAMVHDTGSLQGGGTFFALFSLAEAPTKRREFFLDLLLPSLHLAFLRAVSISAGDNGKKEDPLLPLLSAREIEVLRWVTKGKSNYEIGAILELSTLTVKNHLQKIFRKLNVNNRVQAASRYRALQLFDRSRSKVERSPGRRSSDRINGVLAATSRETDSPGTDMPGTADTPTETDALQKNARLPKKSRRSPFGSLHGDVPVKQEA